MVVVRCVLARLVILLVGQSGGVFAQRVCFLISSRYKKFVFHNFWTKLKAILWSLQTKKLFWNSLAHLSGRQWSLLWKTDTFVFPVNKYKFLIIILGGRNQHWTCSLIIWAYSSVLTGFYFYYRHHHQYRDRYHYLFSLFLLHIIIPLKRLKTLRFSLMCYICYLTLIQDNVT